RVLPVPASSCAVCIASAPGWHIVRKRQYRPYGRAIDGFRLFGTDCRWPFGGCGSNRRAVIPRFGGTPVRRYAGSAVRRFAGWRFAGSAARRSGGPAVRRSGHVRVHRFVRTVRRNGRGRRAVRPVVTVGTPAGRRSRPSAAGGTGPVGRTRSTGRPGGWVSSLPGRAPVDGR